MPAITVKDINSTIDALAILLPGDSFGGVEMLVLRLCEYLRNRGIGFTLVISNHSRILDRINDYSCIYLESIELSSFKASHILLPSVTFSLIDPCRVSLIAKENTKIFCWVVHPTSIWTAFFPRGYELLGIFGFDFSGILSYLFLPHFRRVSSFYCRLIANNSLAAMDGATLRSIQYFYPKTKQYFVPILPIPSEGFCLGHTPVATQVRNRSISLGYLGRLNDFKFSAIKSFFLGSSSFLFQRYESVIFHLVGDGPCSSKISRFCESLGIVVIDHGFTSNEPAKRLFLENVDLGICMGTAALDVALSGVPCLIIDPCHSAKAPPQKLFSFVHEIEQFTLGEYRDFPSYKSGLHSIEEIICILEDSRIVGLNGMNYVSSEHRASSIFETLLDSVANSSTTAFQFYIMIEGINATLKLYESIFYWLRPRLVLRQAKSLLRAFARAVKYRT